MELSRFDAADRTEVVGHALAKAAGLKLKEPHPLSEDVTITNAAGFYKLLETDGRKIRFESRESKDVILTAFQEIVSVIARKTPNYEKLIKRGSLQNFKSSDLITVEVSDLNEKTEGSELELIKHQRNTTENATTVKRFAGFLRFTEEDLLANRWNELGVIASELMRAARSEELKAILSILESNVIMPDGTAMFDAARDNDITGGTGVDEDLLGGAIEKLESYKNTFGSYVTPSPGVIAVPSNLKFKVNRLVKDSGLDLSVFGDPRLTHLYVLPDSPIITLKTLNGDSVPFVNAKRDKDVDAIQLIAQHYLEAAGVSPVAVRMAV